jgi:hypothetical protein
MTLYATAPLRFPPGLRLAHNSRIEMGLLLWADQQGGWKVFGSSTGFHLPDGSVLNPNASLVRLDRWQALTPEQRRGFATLCPGGGTRQPLCSRREPPRAAIAWSTRSKRTVGLPAASSTTKYNPTPVANASSAWVSPSPLRA